MVAHLLRLKLLLLRNSLKRSTWQIVGVVFGVLYGGFFVLMAVIGLIVLRGESDVTLIRNALTVAGAAMILGWWLVPLLAFGADATLDPARFATYAVPPRQLVTGLGIGGLIGLPGLATTLVMLASIVTWSRSVLGLVVAAACALVVLGTCVVGSRLTTTVMSRVLESRRGKDFVAVFGIVAAIVIGPLISWATNGRKTAGVPEFLGSIADVLAWTPLGFAVAAPGDVAAGHAGVGLVRLGLAVVSLIVLTVLWERALVRTLVNPLGSARPASKIAERGDLGMLGRFPASPVWAIGSRMVTYWQRDPRYQANTAMTPLVPLALLIPYFAGGREPALVLLMAPLGAFMVSWAEHNNIAYDSTAFWMHVASGVSGRNDRLGRLVPALMMAGFMCVVYSIVGGILSGRWDLVPGVVGLSVGLAGAGFGMAMIVAVLKPYPVPKPGDSPFATPSGAVGITMIVQTVSFAAVGGLAIPLAILGIMAWTGTTWAAGALLVAGIALGAGYFFAGLSIGSRLYDQRNADLLADLMAVR